MCRARVEGADATCCKDDGICIGYDELCCGIFGALRQQLELPRLTRFKSANGQTFKHTN